jgi:hypothetical protein
MSTTKTPSMSRSHFQFIADTIASLTTSGLTPAQAKKVAEAFANRLGYTNAQFNRGKFIDACTTSTHTTK